MYVDLEKMTFTSKNQEKQIMGQVKVAMKCLGFGWYQSQSCKLTQTVPSKFSMKDYGWNGQSHKRGKCDGRKRFRLFRRRCDEPLFTMSGSSSGGSKKPPRKRPVKTPFNMEFRHIHKSKHIIASVWPRVLLWLGYHFCNQRA